MTRERRHDLYWLGYRHGKRIAQHEPHQDHLPELRLNVLMAGQGRHRPFALGELRGYRVASGLPEPLYGHKVLS